MSIIRNAEDIKGTPKITYLLIALHRLAMIVYGERGRVSRPVMPRDQYHDNMFI
jgi:hypothetical protein